MTTALMQPIADKVKDMLSCPYLRIRCDDNIMSSVDIRGTLTPKDEWPNAIFHNAPGFTFLVSPEKGKRYFDPDDTRVQVSLLTCGPGMPNCRFRRYTGPIASALARIVAWVDSNKPNT